MLMLVMGMVCYSVRPRGCAQSWLVFWICMIGNGKGWIVLVLAKENLNPNQNQSLPPNQSPSPLHQCDIGSHHHPHLPLTQHHHPPPLVQSQIIFHRSLSLPRMFLATLCLHLMLWCLVLRFRLKIKMYPAQPQQKILALGHLHSTHQRADSH